MTENVKECREKFHKVLMGMTPRQNVSDDTFLEKIHTYLESNGKFCCFFAFVISVIVDFIINGKSPSSQMLRLQ